MKKYIVLSGSLVLLLFVLNIILANKYREKESENIILLDKYNELSIRELKLSSGLKRQGLLQYANEGTVLPDLELKQTEDNSTKLSSLLKDGKTRLFFRFRETDCDACIQSSLRLIEKATTHIPKKDIVILSGYTNARQFYAYAKTQSVSVYNVNGLNTPLESQEQPYFFILSDDLKMKNIFISVKGDEKYTSEYLKCMAGKYYHIHDEHCKH